MKKKLVLLIFLLLQNIVIPQELGSPIIVSPLIGDKLDRIENEYFDKIFPSFNGFIEAEFYLSPDSSLTAKVVYEQNKIIKDSVIENVHNLSRLQKYLINKVTRDIDTYSVEEVRIILADDTETPTALFSISKKEVKIFNRVKGEAYAFRNQEIKKIVKQKYVSVSTFGSISTNNLIGSLVGIPVGALIGIALEKESEPNTLDFSPVTAPLLGGILGMTAGYLIGSIIGKTVTIGEEFTANPEGCFCHLDEYTILSMSLKLK